MSDDAATGPLAGVRVVELANVISGPCAGKWLVDLGADVLKVEMPGRGDSFRHWDAQSGVSSPSFDSLNRGKRGITLNLRHPEAREVLTRLVRDADVLTENFRPRYLDGLGLGFDDLKLCNPELIYCSVRGLGFEDERPVFDAIAQAKSGLWSQLTDLDDPSPLGPALADHLTGMSATIAIVAAVVHKGQHHQPQHIEVSMLGSCLAVQANSIGAYLANGTVADASSRPRSSQSYAFVASDGKPFAIHLSTPDKFWRGLTEAIGRPELHRDERFATKPDRVRNYDLLKVILSEAFRTRTRDEWLKILEEHDVPSAPLLNIAEALDDEDTKSLGMLQPFGSDDRRVVSVGLPMRAPWTVPPPRLPVPRLGEHTAEILGALGYDEASIAAMAADGVI